MGTVRDTSVGTIWVVMYLSPVLLVSTGFSSRTMAGAASHVKHVRLTHIHHCAWCRSPFLVSTGFSSCTMAGPASHVKHVRLTHIHHCAWWQSPLVGVDGLLLAHDGKGGLLT